MTSGGPFTHSFRTAGPRCHFFRTPDTYPRIPPVTNTTMMYRRSSVKVNTSIPMKDNTYTIRVVCLEQRQNHQWFPSILLRHTEERGWLPQTIPLICG